MPFGNHKIFRLFGFIGVIIVTMFTIGTSFGMRAGVWRSMGKAKPLRSGSATKFSSITQNSVLNHPSFDVVENFHVKEYKLSGSILTHRKSGAQVISVTAPDDNKVFGITFRTPPSDSTGLPHILEHSVLCGSRKFPVKEPFVDLLRGSLQNFLNAFTYPDRTCYPVASTNTKDFYNLVHVYLDAVLHPRAIHDPLVLQQEGWHYDMNTVEDPLSIKGVVYNEMKGVYSSPEALLGRAIQQHLFPNNTYAVDSGGDPADIPKLTFAQFQEFHRLYYHPANSRIFFYGNDDPYERLVVLDDYLNNFHAIPTTHSQIHYQPKLPLVGTHVKIPFPIAPETTPKHMITLNWLLNDHPWDIKTLFALEILDYLLLGRSTSKLRKVLTESGLGESVTGGGLSDDLLQSTFSIGLKGVLPDKIDQVKALITSTLQSIGTEGFSAEDIQAAINSLEFRMREFNTGSYPKGLSVMLGMTKPWIYDRSPLEGLAFEGPLQALKDDLKANKPIFQDLIRTYFLDNTHSVAVEMVPDSTLESRQAEAEAKAFASIKQSFTPSQLEEIVQATKTLQAAQERPDSPEARATLPRLSVEDIDPLVTPLPTTVIQDVPTHPVTILAHDLPTNGILYADVALDCAMIPLEDVELLPLLVRLLMESNTTHYSANELQRLIDTYTGGIGISFYQDILHTPGKIITPDKEVLLYVMLRGKATQAHVPQLFHLMEEILLHSNLNNPTRALEMVKESKTRKESSVLSSGHSYASTRLTSQHSFLGYYGEVTSGLTSVRRAGQLVEDVEHHWVEKVLPRLERLRQLIVHAMPLPGREQERKLIINLTGEEGLIQASLPTIHTFVEALPSQPPATTVLEKQDVVTSWVAQKDRLLQELNIPASRKEGFAIPSQVNYVGYSGLIYEPQETVEGSTSVVTRYLSNGYMWDNIRVLGGAYGGFVRFSEVSGRLSYLSYRDPNVASSLKTYQQASDFLSEQELSSEDILQAIIGTIGDLDAPMSVDQKGYAAFVQYLTKESLEDQQAWRTGVLQTKAEDFKLFAEKMKKLRENGAIVVFGSAQALEQANNELPDEDKMVIQPAFTNNNANVIVDNEEEPSE